MGRTFIVYGGVFVGKQLAVGILLVLALFFSTSCNNDKSNDENTAINNNIVRIEEFEVSTQHSESNTTAKGTVYVRGNENSVDVTVVAAVEIGKEDWGGVSFYIPEGWTIANVLSSYPERSDLDTVCNNAAIWNTADAESKWKSFIEIGRDRTYIPTGGGTGTVVLDLTCEGKTGKHDSLNLLISVGSEEKDGKRIVGIASTLVEIDLNM